MLKKNSLLAGAAGLMMSACQPSATPEPHLPQQTHNQLEQQLTPVNQVIELCEKKGQELIACLEDPAMEKDLLRIIKYYQENRLGFLKDETPPEWATSHITLPDNVSATTYNGAIQTLSVGGQTFILNRPIVPQSAVVSIKLIRDFNDFIKEQAKQGNLVTGNQFTIIDSRFVKFPMKDKDGMERTYIYNNSWNKCHRLFEIFPQDVNDLTQSGDTIKAFQHPEYCKDALKPGQTITSPYTLVLTRNDKGSIMRTTHSGTDSALINADRKFFSSRGMAEVGTYQNYGTSEEIEKKWGNGDFEPRSFNSEFSFYLPEKEGTARIELSFQQPIAREQKGKSSDLDIAKPTRASICRPKNSMEGHCLSVKYDENGNNPVVVRK